MQTTLQARLQRSPARSGAQRARRCITVQPAAYLAEAKPGSPAPPAPSAPNQLEALKQMSTVSWLGGA